MNPQLAELDYLRDVAARLADAPHGQRGAVVAEATELLRCSRQQLYRRLRDVGWASGRKARADRGRLSIPEEVAVQAAALVRQAVRANGKRTLTISDSLDILRKNGHGVVNPATGEVVLPKSPTTLARAMRRFGCHPGQLAQGKPCVHLRSLHPNHTWQVDPSLCVLFYLRTGGLAVMDESTFYKNKPANLARIANERVWRYVIVDHYSGAIFVKYVLSPGETAQGLVDVFLEAISKRSADDPLHGVPAQLLMDCGSANTSHLFLNLLDRLGVQHLTHLPGNPRAKGAVEVANNIVERRFEGRLAFMRVASLEQLQAEADRWRKHFNAYERHSRTGRTRNDLWLTITEAQLRLAPPLDLCRELVTTKPKEATVRADMTISHAIRGYGRADYDLRYVPGLVPQSKVQVVVNPYRAPAVDVIVSDPVAGDAVWTVEPVAKTDAGFWESAPVIGQEYQALPDTQADTRTKEIEALTGGADRKNLRAPDGLDVMADLKAAPTYIPRRGRDLGLDAARREVAPLSHIEAARALKAALGAAWTAERYAWLVQRYPDGVPADEIDAIAARLAAPEPRAGAVLRAVGGHNA
jgi:transposase InsO family protein